MEHSILSTAGRTYIANSEALSKLWYKLALCPVAKDSLDKLQRMVHKFAVKGCWAESTRVESEIPAILFRFPKSLGGAGLMDVKCQVTALQASLVGDLHANLSLEPERQPKWVQYGTKPDKNYNEPGLMSIV